MNDENIFYFPEAKKWMWTYCHFLGKYIDKDGKKWDLGIVIHDNKFSTSIWSAACVYNNSDGSYISGPDFMYTQPSKKNIDAINEMLKRARNLKLIK